MPGPARRCAADRAAHRFAPGRRQPWFPASVPAAPGRAGVWCPKPADGGAFPAAGPELQGRAIFPGVSRFLAVAQAIPHRAQPPARELQAAKAQRHFLRCRRPRPPGWLLGPAGGCAPPCGMAAAMACSISRRGTIQVARLPAFDRAIRRTRQYSGSYSYSSTSWGIARAAMRCAVMAELPRGKKQAQPVNRIASARDPACAEARSGRTSGCRRSLRRLHSATPQARHRLPNRGGQGLACRSPKWNGAGPRKSPATPRFHRGNGRSRIRRRRLENCSRSTRRASRCAPPATNSSCACRE